jgi:hypothetical protein
VSVFNFLTSFHKSLSDPAAYSSFQKELNSKVIEQIFFNSLAGKKSFRAIVLPQDLGATNASTGNSKILRIRPLDLHDFMIPEPCSFIS